MFDSEWKEITEPEAGVLDSDEVEHYRETGLFSGKLWPLVAIFWGADFAMILMAGLFGPESSFVAGARTLDLDLMFDLNFVYLITAEIPLLVLIRTFQIRGAAADFYLLPDRLIRSRHGRFQAIARSDIRVVRHSWAWFYGRALNIQTDESSLFAVFFVPTVSHEAAHHIVKWFNRGTTP